MDLQRVERPGAQAVPCGAGAGQQHLAIASSASGRPLGHSEALSVHRRGPQAATGALAPPTVATLSADAVPSPFTKTTGAARHSALRALAAAAPVQRVRLFTGMSAWLDTGYAEARELLANPGVIKQLTPSYAALPAEVAAAMSQHLLGANPPDHTRLRRLVAAAFTTRRTEALAPRIQEITDALLDELAAAAQGPVDLVAAYAYPLAITVIAEMLGVPEHGRAEFSRRSGVLITAAAQPREVFVEAATAMVGQVRELVEAKRATPAEDVLSAMIAVRDGSDHLSEDELSSMAFLLLSAGHETTLNLLAAGTHALLTELVAKALRLAEPFTHALEHDSLLPAELRPDPWPPARLRLDSRHT